MKAHLIVFLVIVLFFCQGIKAQIDNVAKIKLIKPAISLEEDVIKVFGEYELDDNHASYEFENESVHIEYSTGECINGWRIPKGRVVEVSVFINDFSRRRKLPKSVDLEMLRVKEHYDEIGKTYYDDQRGVWYTAFPSDKTWRSMGFYPSEKYKKYRCQE